MNSIKRSRAISLIKSFGEMLFEKDCDERILFILNSFSFTKYDLIEEDITEQSE